MYYHLDKPTEYKPGNSFPRPRHSTQEYARSLLISLWQLQAGAVSDSYLPQPWSAVHDADRRRISESKAGVVQQQRTEPSHL